MVHSSGKMLIASSSRIDGVMNSQAMARSDMPPSRKARRCGVGATARSARVLMVGLSFTDRDLVQRFSDLPATCREILWVKGQLDLTLFLEHFLPILDQEIE